MTSTSGPASSAPRVALIGAVLACLVLPGGGCPTDPPPDPKHWDCIIPEGKIPNYRHQVGCLDDFHVLASRPLDASIPGARSGKTIVDQADGNTLYFQNSERYQIHWEFASAWLSGNAGVNRRDGTPRSSGRGGGLRNSTPRAAMCKCDADFFSPRRSYSPEEKMLRYVIE